jgi:hypothetical protein
MAKKAKKAKSAAKKVKKPTKASAPAASGGTGGPEKKGAVGKKVTKAAGAVASADATREAIERAGEVKRRLLEQERERRISAYDAERRGWSTRTGAAPMGFAATGATSSRPALRIVAEGDSWFDYPLEGKPFRAGDVIDRLRDLIPFPILNLALRGDEARFMLGVEERIRLRELLRDPARDFNVLLFSGGGNDIAGNAFRLWVRDRDRAGGDPRRALNDAAFGAILSIVRTAYEDLLDLRDAVMGETPGRTITVFLHEYDWAMPTGVGICGFGPWLKPSLDDRGWTDADEAKEVVREAMIRFALLLHDIASQYTDVVVVRTQGALADGEWHNELHPNRRGFPKIAALFRDALRTRFPGAIP